jgi:transposase
MEWNLIAPLIPPARRGGRRRHVCERSVLEGILYVLETGCQWRHLPKDFPPRSTCHGYFQLWAWDGTLERIHCHLYLCTRELEGREASPTAAIVDSQSIRSAAKGGALQSPSAMMRAKKLRALNTRSLSIPSV